MNRDLGASATPTGLSPTVEPASSLDGSATSIPSAWEPIATAGGLPILNLKVRIRTAAGREFDAVCGWYGCDENGHDVQAWAAWDEDDAPDCWTDGICWSVNESGGQSDQPTHWKSA